MYIVGGIVTTDGRINAEGITSRLVLGSFLSLASKGGDNGSLTQSCLRQSGPIADVFTQAGEVVEVEVACAEMERV